MRSRLRKALSPISDGVRGSSWALELFTRANLKRVHVYNIFRFDLVTLNSKGKFLNWNMEDLGGFQHDLRSDHDIWIFVSASVDCNWCTYSVTVLQFIIVI